ncbi:MAG: hypothetical protein U9Q07_03520 [Planctomycetota bacterium]|nr:hypothetical protein [Planctomycetota bacterium]
MVEEAKCTDMNEDELMRGNNCICPDGKCHLGRKKSRWTDPLCGKCIELWFEDHLPHRIEMMLKPDGSESKWMAMRSLLQFLGLGSGPNLKTGALELWARDTYYDHKKLAKMRKTYKGSEQDKFTYEIRADNLRGDSFDEASLERYKQDNPKDAELLARFIYAAHQHTAHLTWGANHWDGKTIWDVGDPKANLEEEVVRVICILLEERVYKGDRKPPWDKEYNFTGDHD